MARAFLARRSFRASLFKMILFKNLVESKVHKEKMSAMYAFEKLLLNAEDALEGESEADVAFIEQSGVQAEIMKLTNVSSKTSEYILKALMAA